MSSRVTDVGTKFSTFTPEQQPVTEHHAVGGGRAPAASEAGATEAAALRRVGGKEFSRAKFQKYLEAMAIAAGKSLSLPGAYGRHLDRVCQECRDAGMPENAVGVMRYAVGRKLQERIG